MTNKNVKEDKKLLDELDNTYFEIAQNRINKTREKDGRDEIV